MDGSLFTFDPIQPQKDMTRPMIIDSFAGGGGASTGIEMALGRSPDVAINHNEAALALHEANHPETLHMIESIYAVDPDEVCKGRHVGLAWFSPDCKHFSKAKGGKPVSKNIRGLAWVVVHWAERVSPDVIMLENVEEFKTWGPITDEDKPDPARSGETFNEWVKALKKLGYKIQWRELRACDYGAPTIRKRLFVIARRDGLPIVWPDATHGAPSSHEVQAGKLKPWRTAAECIDWSIPCPSIFDTSAQIKEKHGLRAQRPLRPNTLSRVARGLKRYVMDAENPFVVCSTAPSITRFNGGATGQDMRDPMPTITANSYIKRPGGAAPLGIVAPTIIRHFGNSTGQSIATPAPTTMTGGGGKTGIVAPALMSLKGTDRRARDITAPHATVLAGGGHSALISPVLTYAQHGGAVRDVRDVREPHHTICANSKDQNAVIIPTLIQSGYGERAGQAPRCLDMSKPLGTIVAGGIKHAVASAFIAQQNGGPRMASNSGHDARKPMPTITATGSQQTPITAFFAKYYGTGDGARMDEPAHTITTKDRFGHVQPELSAPPFSKDHMNRAREVAEFLRSHDAWVGGEFVTLTIKGVEYVIVDIGLRMLSPRELFNAQGFPSDYVIDGVWEKTEGDWKFKTFTKNVQVSCCGNSVAPNMAEALARANCSHLIEVSAAA